MRIGTAPKTVQDMQKLEELWDGWTRTFNLRTLELPEFKPAPEFALHRPDRGAVPLG